VRGDLQSLFAPHCCPVTQFGEQAGFTHRLVVTEQTFDPQSLLSLQAAPLGHVVAQAACWQTFDMQIPAPQSLFWPHGAMN
jgi:hypothetical protein